MIEVINPAGDESDIAVELPVRSIVDMDKGFGRIAFIVFDLENSKAIANPIWIHSDSVFGISPEVTKCLL